MPLDALAPAPTTSPARFSTPALGDLIFDVLTREEETLETDVTQYPVEDGTPAADHAVNAPRSLTVEGFVTNSPVRSHGGPADAQARVTIPVLDHPIGTAINYADLARRYLHDLWESRALLSYTSRRGTIDNLQVRRIGRIKTRATGDALEFTVQLVRVKKVKLVYVAKPKIRTKSGRAQPLQEAGKQSPTAQGSASRLQSLGFKAEHSPLGNFFTGLFK